MREDASGSEDQSKLRKKKYFLLVASSNNANRRGVGDAFEKTNRDLCGTVHHFKTNQITIIILLEIRCGNSSSLDTWLWMAEVLSHSPYKGASPFGNKWIIALYSDFWLLNLNSLLAALDGRPSWNAIHLKKLNRNGWKAALVRAQARDRKILAVILFFMKKPELSFAKQTAMSSLVWNNYSLRLFPRTELMGFL